MCVPSRHTLGMLWCYVLWERVSPAERSTTLSLSSEELSWLPLTREGHVLPPLIQQPWALPLESLCSIEFQQKGIWRVLGGKPADMGGPSTEERQGEETPAQPSSQDTWTSNNPALWKGVWGRAMIIKICCHEGKQQPELISSLLCMSRYGHTENRTENLFPWAPLMNMHLLVQAICALSRGVTGC